MSVIDDMDNPINEATKVRQKDIACWYLYWSL